MFVYCNWVTIFGIIITIRCKATFYRQNHHIGCSLITSYMNRLLASTEELWYSVKCAKAKFNCTNNHHIHPLKFKDTKPKHSRCVIGAVVVFTHNVFVWFNENSFCIHILKRKRRHSTNYEVYNELCGSSYTNYQSENERTQTQMN